MENKTGLVKVLIASKKEALDAVTHSLLTKFLDCPERLRTHTNAPSSQSVVIRRRRGGWSRWSSESERKRWCAVRPMKRGARERERRSKNFTRGTNGS